MGDLTPVERGALIALMAAGKPLRENADLKGKVGISFNKQHRNKLNELGLIRIVSQRPFTHELTDKGWAWLHDELAVERPKGLMGLGPLYALMNGLGRFLNGRGLTLKEVFLGGGQPVATGTLGASVSEAAWSEADEVLALALQDIPSFDRHLKRFDGSTTEAMERSLKRISLAGELGFQHVRLAGSKRGMQIKDEPGKEVPFDATYYECDEAVAEGETVVVVKAAVVKRSGETTVPIVRGVAEPAYDD